MHLCFGSTNELLVYFTPPLDVAVSIFNYLASCQREQNWRAKASSDKLHGKKMQAGDASDKNKPLAGGGTWVLLRKFFQKFRSCDTCPKEALSLMQLTLHLKAKGNVRAFKWLCGRWRWGVGVGGGLIAIQRHLPCMQICRRWYTVNPDLELERHFNQVQVHRSREMSKWRIYSA